MKHEIDLNKYNIRTDLILESIENNNNKIDTITENHDGILVTSVNVDDKSSSLLNKEKGKYTTILFEDATDSTNDSKIEEVLISVLKEYIGNKNNILVIGLGNAKSTPDSLGPQTIEKLIITRHLFLLGEEVSSGIREVSSFCPGVMADTGIETSNYIKALTMEIKPELVIVIDALAAGSIERVNKSIQITDTGIHPGSGVGNMRKEISLKTIGIPVVAVGVPTVVEASVIVYDTINYLFKHISYLKDNQDKNKLIFTRNNYLNKIKDRDLSPKEKKDVLGVIGELSDTEQKNLINEVLTSVNYNFIVTPKEIDFVIDKLSTIIGNGINKCLHDI